VPIKGTSPRPRLSRALREPNPGSCARPEELHGGLPEMRFNCRELLTFEDTIVNRIMLF
jgi:hypothetical protein